MNIKRIILVLVCIFTLALCSTVSAADTTNNSNSSFHSLQSSASVKNTSSQIPDPIISGVVKDNSTNKGLGNVTIKVIQNSTQVAQTTTNNDGTYSLNFINSNTTYTIIASKLGYMPISKTITV
ncbi:carboxypeptidase regulatory-like domain-containing protein, partial [Methanobacterium sp. A39]|uniref:carboxypeptidase regulatory-like domain-containing protein n=1 Tax=Methanobacterium sp. A39 TaxID=1860100 RepID=UPI000AD6FCED